MPIVKFFTNIRNHWKKTVFGCVATYYLGNYGYNYFDNRSIMRKYCSEAAKYGETSIGAMVVPKKVLVLLNPAANRKSSEKLFNEYCKPILNLAGFLVDVVPTDSVGHARRYVEELQKLPDAIVVAGGDGTISEVVTGLMRRSQQDECPIGLLAVGRTNSIVKNFFNLPNDDEVLSLAETAISIVRARTEKKDILEIQPIADGEENPRPIYALSGIQWGAFIDALNLRDKYWYFGPLREYAASIFSIFGNKLQWSCDAELIFTPPCAGCKNCFNSGRKIVDLTQTSTSRWWSHFVPKFKLGHQQPQTIQQIDYSKITNENCIVEHSIYINPIEILLSADSNENLSKLVIKTDNETKSAFEFLKRSWHRISEHKINDEKLLEGRTLIIKPKNIVTDENEEEKFYYIDNEPFEIRPIRVSVIPKAVNIFVS